MSTPTKPLGVAEVRELLVRAVEEKGADYVYEAIDMGGWSQCVNFTRDGSPSCIAGHAYAYLGLGATDTKELTTVTDVAVLLPDLFTDDAAEALRAAQVAQDEGRTWGEALEAFDRVVAGESE